MRIAYVHYLQAGDTALNHVRQFVSAAEALGHEIHAFPLNSSPGPGASPDSRSAISTRVSDFLKQHFRFYLHEPKQLLLNLPHILRLRRSLEECEPDVLLLRTHLLTFSPLLAGRSLGLPLVLEINAPVLEKKTYGGHYLRLPLLPEAVERWNCRHADMITTVSSTLADYLRSTHELPGSKVIVVPNGADLELFGAHVAADRELSEEIPDDSPVVGFVGSFHKWHGPEILADMILRVSRSRPEVFFLIVGDGPGRQEVLDKVGSLGPRVVFMGSVPHARVPGLVAAIDIGVMPESNFYGSPLKVIEWMAAGKAVVAPAYGPLTDVIEDGVDGLLFPPQDTDALVAAVVRLIDDPEYRKTVGGQAATRVATTLTWRHNAARVMEACQHAVELQRSRDEG